MTTNHLHETMFENGFLPSAMSSITETTSTYLSNKPRTCKFRGKETNPSGLVRNSNWIQT